MKAEQRPANAQPGQQLTAVAGVFTGDAVDTLQHQPGAGGEISEVADRGAHQIQHAGAGFRGSEHRKATWAYELRSRRNGELPMPAP